LALVAPGRKEGKRYRDLMTKREAERAYEEWISLGRPKVKYHNRRHEAQRKWQRAGAGGPSAGGRARGRNDEATARVVK
jgi:hypothetical protein